MNITNSIYKRLAVLQRVLEENRPVRVEVTFMDGSSTTTDPGGAIDILWARGARGEVGGFQTDNPVYSGWARLLTGILHPAPDRRIENFE